MSEGNGSNSAQVSNWQLLQTQISTSPPPKRECEAQSPSLKAPHFAMDSHRSQCVSKGQKHASLTFIIVYSLEKKNGKSDWFGINTNHDRPWYQPWYLGINPVPAAVQLSPPAVAAFVATRRLCRSSWSPSSQRWPETGSSHEHGRYTIWPWLSKIC